MCDLLWQRHQQQRHQCFAEMAVAAIPTEVPISSERRHGAGGHIWTQQHWQPCLGGTVSSHRLILVLFLASMALWPSGDPLINSFSSSVNQSSFSVA